MEKESEKKIAIDMITIQVEKLSIIQSDFRVFASVCSFICSLARLRNTLEKKLNSTIARFVARMFTAP